MASIYDQETANTIWRTWVSSGTNSTATCTTTGSDGIWNSWVTDYYNGTSCSGNTIPFDAATNDKIWFTWVSDYTAGTNDSTVIMEPEPVRIYHERDFERLRREREEINQRAEQRRQEQALRYQIMQDEKEKAEAKAKALLMRLIGKEALEVYEKTGHLFVKGQKNNYIIKKGGGVIKFNEEKISSLCIHLDNRYKYPDTDNVIALKLAIEAKEDWFLEEANESGVRQRGLLDEHIPQAACQPIN